MHSIFLDMRGRALRVLVAEGPAAPYLRTFEAFSPDAGAFKQVMDQVAGETAMHFDKAHLIIPSEDVTVSKYKIQIMPLPDAEKVIRRKIVAEFKIDEPVFHLTPIESDKRQRTYLVELVRPEVVQKYTKLLSAVKLKFRTITSSFNANIRFFRGSQAELPETSGIFDIDNDAIEVTILSHADVIYAERIPLTYPGEEKEPGSATAERAQKMKLYRIMDAIYKVHLSYRELYPDNAIQKIWICGLRGGAEGVADALSEAVDAKIVSGDNASPQGYSYSALFGLSEGIIDGTAVNFVTRKSLRQLTDRTIRILMAAAACVAIISMISGYAFYENKLGKERDLLEAAQKQQTARQAAAGKQVSPYLAYREQINMLERTQVGYYDMLRFIANRIPDGIVLEKISFRQDQAKGMIDLFFLAPHNPKTGREHVLIKLADMISGIDACRRHQEPVITVVARDKEKFLRTEYRCEAYTIEKKN